MTRFLIFQLYGPLASWGEVAVGEVRATATHPTRSAVLGLLGGALGIRRQNQAELGRLAGAVTVATELLLMGTGLSDYHTTQVPTEPVLRAARRAGVAVRTRRDALQLRGLKTILSRRDYRQDAFYRAVVACRDGVESLSLGELRAALMEPRFTPYLGRRACPTALPFGPQIVEAQSGIEALDSTSLVLPDSVARLLRARMRGKNRLLAWESTFPMGIDAHREHERRDDPDHSRARLFRVRTELQVSMANQLR